MRQGAHPDAQSVPGESDRSPATLVRTTPALKVAMLSDPGRERSLNEDAALVLDLPGGGLFAVADGMGGHAAGDVASRLAIDELREAYQHTLSVTPERLADAVQAANLAVYRHAVGSEAGMGTTLTAVVVDGAAALIANVGDSRAYLFRGGTLARLTRDHSWVAEQVRLGFLSEEEARAHHWRNVVSNALGSEERVRLDLLGVPLERGDRLLVCSDGLTTVVDDADIAQLLAHAPDLADLPAQLVAAANARGGPDNITVLVIEVRAAAQRPRYVLPTLSDDGPVDVDIIRTPSPRRPVTYLTLAVLYLTLLGMIILPEHNVTIASVGMLALAALLLAPRLLQRDVPDRAARDGARPLPERPEKSAPE